MKSLPSKSGFLQLPLPTLNALRLFVSVAQRIVGRRRTWSCVPLPLETGSVISQFMDLCTAFFQRV